MGSRVFFFPFLKESLLQFMQMVGHCGGSRFFACSTVRGRFDDFPLFSSLLSSPVALCLFPTASSSLLFSPGLFRGRRHLSSLCKNMKGGGGEKEGKNLFGVTVTELVAGPRGS